MIGPIVIGLTGAIGTGKSSVAAELERRGSLIVSGDDLGRRVLEDSPGLLAAVRGRFGADVFHADGHLDRRELGRRVFASPDEAQWLTRLTFPGIHELWLETVRSASRDVVVLDAALIVEWGIADEFDHVLVVTAPASAAMARLAASGRLTEAEAEMRRAVQMDPHAKVARATHRISNSGTLDDLRKQVEVFWKDTIVPQLEARRKQRNASES